MSIAIPIVFFILGAGISFEAGHWSASKDIRGEWPFDRRKRNIFLWCIAVCLFLSVATLIFIVIQKKYEELFFFLIPQAFVVAYCFFGNKLFTMRHLRRRKCRFAGNTP